MQYKLNRQQKFFILFFLTLSLLLTTSTRPVYSHWSDLSVAEIIVNDLQTELTLTFPTGLTNFADDNRDSQLQPAEVRSHQTQLEKFFSQQIRITNSSNIPGTIEVKPPGPHLLKRKPPVYLMQFPSQKTRNCGLITICFCREW